MCHTKPKSIYCVSLKLQLELFLLKQLKQGNNIPSQFFLSWQHPSEHEASNKQTDKNPFLKGFFFQITISFWNIFILVI